MEKQSINFVYSKIFERARKITEAYLADLDRTLKDVQEISDEEYLLRVIMGTTTSNINHFLTPLMDINKVIHSMAKIDITAKDK